MSEIRRIFAKQSLIFDVSDNKQVRHIEYLECLETKNFLVCINTPKTNSVGELVDHRVIGFEGDSLSALKYFIGKCVVYRHFYNHIELNKIIREIEQCISQTYS